MNIKNINLDNQIFKIIFKTLFYRPLIIALWNLLSENEKQSLIFNNNSDQKIINLNDIFNLFSYNFIDSLNFCKDPNLLYKCICGKSIEYLHIIKHIKTSNQLFIGSECIDCWNDPKYSRLKNIKSELNYCHFCFKKTKCMNCSKKQNINLIFNKWKYYFRCKTNKLIVIYNSFVKFGKYKDSKLIKLCQDDNYSNYILNNTFNETIKNNILTYRKNKILLNKRLN